MKNKQNNLQNLNHISKVVKFKNQDRENDSFLSKFKQIKDRVDDFTKDEKLRHIINSRLELGQYLVIFVQILGMLINYFIFQDLPTEDVLSQNFKFAVQTVHGIGAEEYNHIYTDKPQFPAWLQKLVWTFYSFIGTSTDVQNSDVKFKQAEVLIPKEEFIGVQQNLAKLAVASTTHSLLNQSDATTFMNIVGGVWQCQQTQQRVGFGQMVDSGTGFASLFIPGSITIVGDSIVAMNSMSEYSLVGTLAHEIRDLIFDDTDDSEGDDIDYEWFQGNFGLFGLFQFGTIAVFARLIHGENAKIIDLDLAEQLPMPWQNLMFPLWNMTLGIGISPKPISTRDKVFFFCFLQIMTKMSIMFGDAQNELIQLYFPHGKHNVAIMFAVSLCFYVLMDYTAVLALVAAPTLDGVLNKLADAVQNGYDLASTTGNGDILPGDQNRYLMMIIYNYMWSQILGYQYAWTNLLQDHITSKVIEKHTGLKNELFYVNDKSQQETGISGGDVTENDNGHGGSNQTFMDKLRKEKFGDVDTEVKQNGEENGKKDKHNNVMKIELGDEGTIVKQNGEENAKKDKMNNVIDKEVKEKLKKMFEDKNKNELQSSKNNKDIQNQ